MARFDEPDVTADDIAEAMERSGQPRPQGNRVLPTLVGRGAPSQAVPSAQWRNDAPVAVVDTLDWPQCRIIGRFDTITEAEAFVATLPGVETGRYGIDAPESWN